MKNIYNYLLACLAITVVFTSCRPLSDTDLGATRQVIPPVVVPPTIASITLTGADFFALPPTNPAQTQQFFRSAADAISSMPTILNAKYPTASDKSQITVTYPLTPVIPAAFKPADSVFTHVAYTLVNPDDYLLVPKNTFIDFSASQIITWLGIKYPAPVANQLAVLTFIYYESGSTSTVTQSFIYLNGAWKKTYLVSPAQYTSIGKGGTSNDFASGDVPNLAGYFNTFLKADAAVASTAKFGDIQYVSYKYYGGSAANTFQRVMPLVFDGTNWVGTAASGSGIFTKTNGQWGVTLDNTIAYTLATADYTTITKIPNVSQPEAISNLVAHGNFSVVGAVKAATKWTDTQIATGIIAILKANYGATATKDQKFVVTFSTYGGYTTETETFKYDGANFVFIPVPDNTRYTLTGDDYATITAIPNVGAQPSIDNLNSYGNFSLSGATAWTNAQIWAGIAAVLKTRYTAPTANQQVVVTYAIYSGGNVTTTKTFKYDGTNFVAI